MISVQELLCCLFANCTKAEVVRACQK